MSAPAQDPIAWFEPGGDDGDVIERFYGRLLGWTSEHGDGYRVVNTGGGHPVGGGFVETGGPVPGYAVFQVAVEDVAATCAEAERLGGTVLTGPTAPDDGPVFAHLLDPAGNRFGVFAAPPAG